MDKKIYSFSSLKTADVIKEFGSSLASGLSSKVVAEKLKLEGKNEFNDDQAHWWQIFLRQLKSPFIYLLLAASVLAFFLGEALDGWMILLFIIINTFLGFYQEFKSEQALKLLRQYTKSVVKVIRGGKQIVVDSSCLVTGDIVILETGDRVPADIRLLEESDLIVDETVLTGESIAVHKSGLTLLKTPTDMYGATNLVFSGTNIVGGESKGIVLMTGQNTAFGQIKQLTTETAKESIFAKGISQFSSFILKLTVITLIFVFLANIAIKGDEANIFELLIFSVALAVSVIPEALPVVTTLSLSRGALKLAKKKVIIKRLSAVEDLGSIEILCTDKTGTITENKLRVNELLPLDGRDNLLIYANLAGAFLKESLEPFDIALNNALTNKKSLSGFKKISECPFDPKRRRNSVLVADKSNNKVLIVRGAPEEIFNLCVNMDGKSRKIFKEWLFNEEQQGHRVLAVATKIIDSNIPTDISILEDKLTCDGCISFVDPIKKSTYQAVKKANKLGVSIKIITGDSLTVSTNVAKQIGLVSGSSNVVLTAEFLAWTEKRQKQLLPAISVFARTDPEQKHQLIKLLQENFEVGFLGEGINDSPALKAAGVSIVVESASDISREAADIILLKKDLSVIIDGIEEGRKIFTNTIKYLKSTLASNFGNFYAVALSSLFINFLPMLPVQLLLVNLLSDFPMIAIVTDSVDINETKAPKKYHANDVIVIATILGVVSMIFDFIIFGFFYQISPEVLQTNWFIGSILTELVFLFSIRTRLPFYKAAFPSRTVIWLTLSAAIATVIIPFTIIGQRVFHFVRPSFSHLFIIFGLVAAYFVCSEIIKNMYYRNNNK